MSTQTALQGNTSLTPPASKPRLQINNDLPAEEVIRAHAAQAFREEKEGSAKVGTAEQRIAYAALAEAASLVKSRVTNYALADYLTDPEIKKWWNDTMVDFFVHDKPTTGTTEAAATEMETWNRRAKLVKRGVFIAVIMASRGVTHGMFDLEAKSFAVWPNMLYPVGSSPIGRLATDETILLDGRSFVYSAKDKKGGDVPGKGYATITTMLSFCKPAPKPRGAKATAKVTSGATFDFAKSRDVAKHIKAPVLIGALYETLVVIGSKADRKPRRDDSPTAWATLSKVMEWFDEVRKSPEWELPRDADADKVAEHKATKAEAAAAAKAKRDAAKTAKTDNAA